MVPRLGWLAMAPGVGWLAMAPGVGWLAMATGVGWLAMVHGDKLPWRLESSGHVADSWLAGHGD